jgi:hypothetical protein
MAHPFNVGGAQFAKFGTPGTNSGHGDVVVSRDIVDRVRPRFAQDFYYLTFRKLHCFHGELLVTSNATMFRRCAARQTRCIEWAEDRFAIAYPVNIRDA